MSQDRFRIAIVGSGPGGISAATHAAKLGVSHILLERTDHLSDTIYKYQRGKFVMATPDVLPLRADVGFAAGKREAVLGNWDKQVSELKTNVRYNAEVVEIKKDGDIFNLKLASGDMVQAENVVLAIGLQGNLNKLACPGADNPMVQYQLDDPEEYEAENIIVIGAGDAGVENAVALAKQNSVVILNREGEFARVKQGNLTLILNAIEKGDIQCYYNSDPARIEDKAMIINTAEGEARVPCDRIIARIGASAPRKFVESCGVVFPSKDRSALPEVSPTYESNVKGLYIIGALGGYPLIKQAMNQGYEVVEYIMGNKIAPADEPLLRKKIAPLKTEDVDAVVNEVRAVIPVFAALNPLVLREVMLESDFHAIKQGGTVFRRNDYTNSFFTVLRGSVAIELNPADPSQVVKLTPGAFFGEMGLISGRRRTATVVAASDCVLLETPRRTMLKLIGSVESVRRTLDQTAIMRQVQTHLAPGVPTEALKPLVESAELKRFKPGEVIFQQGDKGDDMHLIRAGSCTVSMRVGGRDIVLSYVPSGNYIGEMALLSDAPRSATVKAAHATETIRIQGDAFKALLNGQPELKAKVEAKFRQRIMQNEQMQRRPEAGNIIQFLIEQGVGEGTDVLLIDESLCVHCDNCEKACAETHGGISRLDREAGPSFATIHVPTSCRHCEHPHCMSDCPPNAIHRTPGGEVYIDDSCIGCGNCERNCPYKVIQLAAPPEEKFNIFSWLLFGKGPGPGEEMDYEYKKKKAAGDAYVDKAKRAVKCDMCKGIEGGASCVRACPTGAAMRVSPEEFMSVALLTQ
ncbi:MAG: cyclic nucleotide-binding domain-containing protein [Rhodospirillaceae bacterium]|nr:cyclic nucleotide-binding domain-containing protein [Rhodospirillaceae bacterium]